MLAVKLWTTRGGGEGGAEGDYLVKYMRPSLDFCGGFGDVECVGGKEGAAVVVVVVGGWWAHGGKG